MNRPPDAPPGELDIFTAYGSNGFRLNLLQWGIVLGLSAVFVVSAPLIWKRAEKLDLGSDFRMNYDASNDYWLYNRAVDLASAKCDIVVMGDSVVWGQYAANDETLSHYLNEYFGSERAANLGLDGAHPLALAGLIRSYAGSVSEKKVILVCNPLWMSSPKHDLQSSEEFRFNHPKLVPQFLPRIPCYKESVTTRLGNLVERNSSFNGWTAHLQSAYFEKSDIPAWTLDHPYEMALSSFTFTLPKADKKAPHEPIPWTEQHIQKQDFPFVDLATSLQWRAFKDAVEILKSRGNKVLVVISPLNEHMLVESSRNRCQKMRIDMESELRTTMPDVQCFVPPALPTELYADASHPLAGGYKLLAKQIFERVIGTP